MKREKKRQKDYNFRRQCNGKQSVIPGCPGAAAACMSDAQPREHKFGSTSGLKDNLRFDVGKLCLQGFDKYGVGAHTAVPTTHLQKALGLKVCLH